MTNAQLIEAAIQDSGNLEWKVKNFKGNRDLGIMHIEGHPTYLRVINWKRKQTNRKKLLVNIEVYLVPENKTVAKRLVTNHELEVDYATA